MNTNSASIQFKGIELLSKQMVERPLEKDEVLDQFDFNVSASSSVNPPAKLVFVRVDVNISERGKQEVRFSISLLCGFEVVNFEEVIKEGDGGLLIVPPEIDALLKSISISTTRGVIFSEIKGTYLFNAILPIILISKEQAEKAQAEHLQKLSKLP